MKLQLCGNLNIKEQISFKNCQSAIKHCIPTLHISCRKNIWLDSKCIHEIFQPKYANNLHEFTKCGLEQPRRAESSLVTHFVCWTFFLPLLRACLQAKRYFRKWYCLFCYYTAMWCNFLMLWNISVVTEALPEKPRKFLIIIRTSCRIPLKHNKRLIDWLIKKSFIFQF